MRLTVLQNIMHNTDAIYAKWHKVKRYKEVMLCAKLFHI